MTECIIKLVTNTLKGNNTAFLNEKQLFNSCVTNPKDTNNIDRTQKVIQNNKIKIIIQSAIYKTKSTQGNKIYPPIT